MKKILSAILLLVSFTASAQTNFTEVVEAFATGNVDKIAENMNSTVELMAPSVDDVYSRPQAKLILKKFFEKNPPTKASVLHKGSSGGGADFVIISLKTSNGDYRVHLFLKSKDNRKLIQEIKIEK